ncbi:MAG TPA: AI-2E family transporter [Jiangellaceae bacterium]|nr:AI-2E family transporter [Jiangellaceae bacterium]
MGTLPDGSPVAAVTAPKPGLWHDSFGRAAARAGQALVLGAAGAVLIWLLVTLRLVVVPLVIATIIASAVSPVMRALRLRGVPPALAAIAALVAGLGVVGLLGWLIVAGVRDEWRELRDQAVEGVEELERSLAEGPLSLTQAQIQQGREAVVELLSGEEVRAGVIGGAVLAFEVIAGIFLTIVILYFLLKDGPRIWRFLLRPVSEAHRQRLLLVGERAVDVLGGYVRGTAIIALVDAVIIGVALVILQVPLALPLAVLVFLGAFIPLAGATISGAFAALVALVANGWVTAVIVVVIVIAVNQIEGDVLAPAVLGRAVSLHPLAILLALTGGAIVAGILGALLAVPVTAVVWTAITAWAETGPGAGGTARAGP